MSTAEVNVHTELDQVEHWRAQELIRAGLPGRVRREARGAP